MMSRDDSVGHVYVCKSASGLFKIGQSRQLARRVNSLGREENGGVELVLSVPCKWPWKIEAVLLGRYASVRVQGEWFRLTAAHLTELPEVIGEEIERLGAHPVGLPMAEKRACSFSLSADGRQRLTNFAESNGVPRAAILEVLIRCAFEDANFFGRDPCPELQRPRQRSRQRQRLYPLGVRLSEVSLSRLSSIAERIRLDKTQVMEAILRIAEAGEVTMMPRKEVTT